MRKLLSVAGALTILSLICITPLSAGPTTQNENIIWRVPSPVVRQGKYNSMIADRGELQKAIRAQNGNYLFSEKGAGVKPIAIIGTATQIVDFLLSNSSREIENKIPELQDIYIGLTKYKPYSRFTDLFPMGDAITQFVQQAAKFVPGTDLTDLVGSPGDLRDLKEAIKNLSNEQKENGNILYLKISYLPEDKMEKIGIGSVSFKRIFSTMQSQWKIRKN